MRRFFTPRWVLGHVLMLAGVAVCLVAGRWQYERATAGNMLSWAYTVQWPLFAVFVVFLWARAVRDARGVRAPRPAPPPLRPLHQPPVVRHSDDDDPELAAYNRMLAWLAADPDRRPSDFPG
ncbi:hypothetical protein KZZ52_54350 [Dactylosporangium sp. AC04546]|uniref:hypothetical protein n=1 Tax=Dactylosporangium sp. AC04546 TaxID=2862460 RepID=UPI001EDE14DC|nr:hypothetical protein [Dactylosporangium sp. AC04546]WVK82827.1 hypothetical protein KZZ52_54350 [Dactylosporangium sp. AC04546]